jgi:O-antigen/teichoic acid export membrane protein
LKPPSRSVLRVSKNAFARLAAQVWAKLLSIALVALVARYETAESLGRYVLVLTIVAIAGALADLGLNTFLTREVARETDNEGWRDLLGTTLLLKVSLSLVGLAGLVVVAALQIFPPATSPLIAVGGLLLLPEAMVGTMRAFVNARQRMEVSGLIDMTIRLIAVAGSWPALSAGFGVAGVILCTVGATWLGALLYGAILLRWRAIPSWSWSVRRWLSYLQESYPFALTSIVAMVYARIDLLLLGLWQGELAAGWYGAAYKLWEALGLLPASLLEALFPEMSRLSSSPQGLQSLRRLFRRGSPWMLAGGLLLATGGILVAGPLLSLVYGGNGEYAPAVAPLRLLLLATPAMFLYLLSGHVLYALGQQRRVTVAMFIVGGLNIVLNLIVIPRWSFLGAAAVALASEWLLLVLVYPQAYRALDRQGGRS